MKMIKIDILVLFAILLLGLTLDEEEAGQTLD